MDRIDERLIDEIYQGLDDVLDVPIENRLQFMEAQIEPVIGHTGLRKIISHDFLTPLACAHL